MNKFKTFCCNVIFILFCFPEWLYFNIYLKNYFKIQQKILKRIILTNKSTIYGKKYNFDKIKTISDFQKYVPIINYDDIENYIDEISDKDNILTKEKIKMLEPTSGSTGGTKLIPYTEELRKEFQKGIKVWLFDLYIHNPKLFLYKSYWSISPKTQTNNNTGFENDEEYFSKTEQIFLKNIMVIPDIQSDFRKNTKKFLNKEKNNIGLISIWSPTFLDGVLDKEILDFKNLQIISCWADASSKFYAENLSKQYKNAKLQPKGLLSTEGIVSFPLSNIGNVVSYNSHFYEFIDKNNDIKTLDELKANEFYTVIITTSGGLYRYNTHDKIEVLGFKNNLPIIKFIGRDNNVSDFFGEKISEDFINNLLPTLFDNLPDFMSLGFWGNKYILILEQNQNIDIPKLQEKLEKGLQENYHYKNCIELKQLEPCEVHFVDNGLAKYYQYYLNKGMKQGDIKIKLLDSNICDIFML